MDVGKCTALHPDRAERPEPWKAGLAMIKVAVFGSQGRMGRQVAAAVQAAPDMELVAAVDAGEDRGAVDSADVVVDFTTPDSVMDNIKWCVDRGIHVVVGTTGFTAARLAEVRRWQAARPEVHILIAANFSIAAILMMHFAAQAAPFFESVEIVELHHPGKVDAPSGTAAATAAKVAEARAAAHCPPMPDLTGHQGQGARGTAIDGVQVHSVRLQGLFAHQEVLLGNPGEMLTIRDDSFDRVSYMPGVLTAVRAIIDRPGVSIGIDGLLGIG